VLADETARNLLSRQSTSIMNAKKLNSVHNKINLEGGNYLWLFGRRILGGEGAVPAHDRLRIYENKG
jgi:hypothetical protein